jgi:UDP-N-acetylmuramyl tripeptide synthase
MQKNKEVINKSGILKIIGRVHEEFREINGTKRLLSDQRVVEDML